MSARLQRLSVDDVTRVEFVAMDQADAEQVADWRYPGIYAFYDFRADAEDAEELLDARQRAGAYFSARVPGVGLIGFVELKPVLAGELEIGLGLRPECAGRGLGVAYVTLLCHWARDRVGPERVALRVATFNARAIRVYTRAGFSPVATETVDSHGTAVEFLRMELTASRGPHGPAPG